ncbi:MAG: sigma-70 family RNA polymerase sigma factor, partial [Myxococcota bacterium]
VALADLSYSASRSVMAEETASIRNRIYQAIVNTGWRPDHAGRRSGGAHAYPYSSDHDQLKAFIAGDSDAFDALAKTHLPRLLGYARRRVPPFEADEIVQEAFLVLIRRANDVVRDRRPVGGFLRRSVDRLVLAYWRKQPDDPMLPVDDDLISDEAAVDIVDVIRRQEDIARVAEALARVCNALEEQVVLHTLEGDDPAEIAEALKLPVNRVRVAKHRALRKLQGELQKGEGEP